MSAPVDSGSEGRVGIYVGTKQFVAKSPAPPPALKILVVAAELIAVHPPPAKIPRRAGKQSAVSPANVRENSTV